jgi:hypothetical protein
VQVTMPISPKRLKMARCCPSNNDDGSSTSDNNTLADSIQGKDQQNAIKTAAVGRVRSKGAYSCHAGKWFKLVRLDRSSRKQNFTFYSPVARRCSWTTGRQCRLVVETAKQATQSRALQPRHGPEANKVPGRRRRTSI